MLSTSANVATSAASLKDEIKDKSLLEYLDIKQINCLNESDGHTLSSILANKSKDTSGSYLQSDADEQLLLNVPFNRSVRIRSISIKTNNVPQGPKLIKLFINRPAIGFEDVEEAEEPAAAQIIEVSDDDIRDGNPIQLRYVRFQAVNSLHIFVGSNQGEEDITRIDALDISGAPNEATRNMAEVKQQQEQHEH